MDYKEYIESVDKYIETQKSQPSTINSILRGKYVTQFCLDHNKWVCDFDDMELRECLKGYNFKTYKTIARYRAVYRDYYDFLIGQGYRYDNPSASGISTVSILEQNNNTGRKYYTDNDFKTRINKLNRNEIYYEAIARSYFEGVALYAGALENLKQSDLNVANKTILSNGNIIHISKRLTYIYTQLPHITKFETSSVDGRSYKMELPHVDSLFPVSSANFTSTINKRAYDIEEITGIKMVSKDLYMNGFINYIIDHVGKEKAVDYVLSDGRYCLSDVEKFIEDYGLFIKVNRFRHVFRPYVLSVKDQILT